MKAGRLILRALALLCLTVMIPCVSALGETTKVAAYLLRLREKPSGDSKVLDAYPRGTKVTILKKGSEWTRVKVQGKTGYMQTRYLAYAKSQSSGAGNAGSSTKETQPKSTLLLLLMLLP